ncbi:hypothetical protein [Flavobacterium sp.]|uniref:hypothetical protein n=1 Tax=Flavobacterium sp. TaxID=239 RepID=UPI003A9062A9
MSKVLLLLLVFVLFGCKSQKTIRSISCDTDVEVQFDRIKFSDRNMPKADRKLKSFTVFFMGAVNDTVKVYVNNKIVYNNYISKTDNNHSLNENFIYDYSKDTDAPVIKVKLVNQNTCFDMVLDQYNYKLVYVFFYRESWIMRYSNIYYLH